MGSHGEGGEPYESRPGHSLKDQLVLEFRGTHKSVTSHTRTRGTERQGDIQELGTLFCHRFLEPGQGLSQVHELRQRDQAVQKWRCQLTPFSSFMPCYSGLSGFPKRGGLVGGRGAVQGWACSWEATGKPPVCALKDQTHCCFGNLVMPAQCCGACSTLDLILGVGL